MWRLRTGLRTRRGSGPCRPSTCRSECPAWCLRWCSYLVSPLILDYTKLDCAKIIARNLAGASTLIFGSTRPRRALRHPGGHLLVGAVDRSAPLGETRVDPAREEIGG